IVKVLDFGLVRNVSTTAGKPRDKSLAGTPAYMSPESFLTPDRVDARSDIYAVGALGYYLLTGTHAVEMSSAAIQLRQYSRPLLTPSQKLGRPVDLELSNVLMNCLEPNRNNRPQTTAELTAQLVACSSASQWSRKQSSEWWDNLKPRGSSSARDDLENGIGSVETLTADEPC
ncbi:MAG: protein kinase, partial [Aureliella sp.]